MKKNLFITLMLAFFSVSQYAQGEEASQFPAQVSFEHAGTKYQLEKTGEATRKKFFVKVYYVASYLENGVVTNKANAFDQILTDNKAKQLTLKFVHEASASKIHEAYEDSFKKEISGEEYAAMRKDIDTYMGFFNADVNVGDEQVIRWLPGGYIEVIINGKSAGNITNPAFAKALFSIWFGPNSIVKREDLVALIK